ncbi:MAG TPA: tetratricopeptide repeat protein [Pyrinomonadaceae bacterium]|nr:tetratricopeptide repeat protein [Pyrinomonadaceae bacterium]
MRTFKGALASVLVLSFVACANTSALAQKKTRTATAAAASKGKAPAAKVPARGVTVSTQPGAIVWIDEVRRGVADAAGQLQLTNVSAGRHTLRVRAKGFAERTLPLLPAQRGLITVRLVPTTDEAELLFQQAEEAREKGGGDEGRRNAAELYRRALKLRPRFPAAHVGLARVLSAQDDFDGALEQITEARRDRPVYPEASAVEGRILRATADNDAAIESYQRAIREGRGFQPEAYAGMGIVLEEKGDYEGAVAAFRKAIAQLSESEPALYQLIGAAYEKLERWKEAVAAYEKYLELAPEGGQASAIRSIIDQLRQQAAEQQQQTTPQ